MSVFVIVPTMSRPMFMPDRTRSFQPRSGATACTSERAEEMLIATSITAPSALMTTPATSRPRRPMGVPVWRSCSSGSTSDRRSPSTCSSACAARPKAIASATPASVPTMAQTVLRRKPPRIVSVTTVIYAHTSSVVSSVGAPFISSGMRIQNRHASVTASPTSDFAPTFPPTSTVTSRNSPTITISGSVRLYSNTVAVCVPPL